MPTFHYDGIGFHYEVVGTQEPLVVCHGLTGDLSAPRDLLGPLPGYRLILVDARAHGRTQPLGPASKLCFQQFADDLDSLLHHLKVDRAVVGGISMGAGVATRFAIDHRDRVRGLILIRPAWLDRPFPENLSLAPLAARLFDKYGPNAWQAEFDQHLTVRKLSRDDPLHVEAMRRNFDDSLSVERRERLIRIPGDCPITSWEEAESLDLPALVIGCESDAAHPYSFAKEWASRLPNYRLKTAATKSLDFERHARDVRAYVCDFLSTIGNPDRERSVHSD